MLQKKKSLNVKVTIRLRICLKVAKILLAGNMDVGSKNNILPPTYKETSSKHISTYVKDIIKHSMKLKSWKSNS